MSEKGPDKAVTRYLDREGNEIAEEEYRKIQFGEAPAKPKKPAPTKETKEE